MSANGRPGTRQDIRNPHRGAVLPIDAYSLAVACGGRGVSRDIWPASLSAPSVPRVVRLPGHDRDRSPSRTTRRATTWFPPRRVLPAGAGSLPRLGSPPWPLWYAPSARYREFGVRCLCDASSTACAAALQRGTGAALGAAFTRRALRPVNVARGDRCVRGTLAPRHHAGTNNQQALGATGLKADQRPVTTAVSPPSDRPRKAASSSSAWTTSTKCSGGSKAASEHAGGLFGPSARAGYRIGPHEGKAALRPQHRHRRIQIRTLDQGVMPCSRRRLDRLGNRLRLTALDAGPLELAGH